MSNLVELNADVTAANDRCEEIERRIANLKGQLAAAERELEAACDRRWDVETEILRSGSADDQRSIMERREAVLGMPSWRAGRPC